MKRTQFISIAVIFMVCACIAAPVKARIGQLTDAGIRFAPENGYGQAKGEDVFDLFIFTQEGDVNADGLTAVGFDGFVADSGYALRVGVIPETLWSGTDADWDVGLYLHIEWTTGNSGRAYTVVDGVSDPDTLGSIEIADLLGGIDLCSFDDVLAGGSSVFGSIDDSSTSDPESKLVMFATQGYPGTTTLEHTITGQTLEEGASGFYLISQVMDLNQTNHEIGVDMWYGIVPEPCTLLLLSLGGFALRFRRGQKQ